MRTCLKLTALLACIAFPVGRAEAASPLGFDEDRPVMCSHEKDGSTLRIQCDEGTKVCLTAMANVVGSDGKPTRVFAKMLNPCSTSITGLRAAMEADGYTMRPGVLETPYGYDRDERGRLYQTHFDLTRRWYLGVGTASYAPLWSREDWSTTLRVESSAFYERFDEFDERRNRHRFLVGSLLLEPFEVEAELYRYNRGRTGDVAPIWITTLVGAPERYDINIHVGPTFVLGRVFRRQFDSTAQTVADFGELNLQWEVLQGARMEDYLAVTTGVGAGIRRADSETPWMFLYPNVGLSGAWLVGERGLSEVRADVVWRRAWEPGNGGTWDKFDASASFERIVLAVNDQPISLFVGPRVRSMRVEDDGLDAWDLRVEAGIRVSLLTPPKLPEDSCPHESEDYDGYQDDDGCPDPDNDGDGVLDSDDACPVVPGSVELGGCPQ